MSISELFDSDRVITDNYLGKASLYLRRSFAAETLNLTNGTVTSAPLHIPFDTVIRNTGGFTFSTSLGEQSYIHIDKSGYYRISYNINIVKDAEYPNITGKVFHLIAFSTDIDYKVDSSYTAISGDVVEIEAEDTEAICQWTSTEQLNEGMTIRIAIGSVGEVTTPRPQQFNIRALSGNYPNGKTPPRVAAEIFIDRV